MSLKQLINKDKTDKDTQHTYLDTYQKLFDPKKESARHILEIGIERGGSIKLWSDFFTNATIYGVDTMSIDVCWKEIMNKPNIILHTSTNAYNPEYIINNFINKGVKFDVLIDDGPHSLESMIIFINLYTQILADDGILIIEDVQHLEWTTTLSNVVPEELKKYIKIHDLRPNIGRHDDILFIIDKSNK